MREGLPSVTAQRVAACRLGFDRPAAPYGDAAADDRLAADVASSAALAPSERMSRYLRARTSFFDRVVLSALDREVKQLVVVGAGYDGRALRYAKPGVRWFEVDDPATQRDKRARLERLGIDTRHVSFIGADLREPGLASALTAGGFEPDLPSPIVCEGVAVYLDLAVLERLLQELRAIATAGTRLALSASVSLPTADAGARERFAATVQAAGEPARSTLTAQQASELLGRARWRAVELSGRAKQLGFLVAAPMWAPALPPAPVSVSRVGTYLERTYHRSGADSLASHLQATYDIGVERLHQLDVGVHRADLRDGRRWIARVFAASRPFDAAQAETSVLRFLAEAGFPAERCAHPEPVSAHHGQAVVVTEHVTGKTPPASQATFRALGDLLGRLHALTPASGLALRPGGAWHHLAHGGPREEIVAATALLDDAGPRVPASRQAQFAALREELVHADACDGLPHALVHPDFVPANAIAAATGGMVIVDWAGVGLGPRL
jgi:methyltransferase (TIGR00027 family)